MQSIKHRKGVRRIWLSIVGIVIIALMAIVVWSAIANTPAAVDNLPASLNTQTPEPKPISLSSSILFTGNTYWGRYINDWSMSSTLKYAYPFSRLNEFDRDSYDAWISGLECPTVAGVQMTSAEEDATLTFNCSPEYLPEAAKWFTAFSLANNHTDNQGVDGFAETLQHLEENNIQYFGHYDPRSLDDVCEIISMPVTVKNDDDTSIKGYLPIAMCGYHGVFRLPLPDSVAVMQKYSPYMPVIAMPQMGTEYVPTPDQLKIDFYRSLIDGGADAVMGDHPHWIQTTESYKGHLIVYSMGNFIFDQQDTAEVVRSAAIRMVLDIDNDTSEIMDKWLAVGNLCKTFKDDCLQQIKQLQLPKLDVKYQFSVIGTNDSNKIVKPATADQQKSILERLDWANTIKSLQVPYSGL